MKMTLNRGTGTNQLGKDSHQLSYKSFTPFSLDTHATILPNTHNEDSKHLRLSSCSEAFHAHRNPKCRRRHQYSPLLRRKATLFSANPRNRPPKRKSSKIGNRSAESLSCTGSSAQGSS